MFERSLRPVIIAVALGLLAVSVLSVAAPPTVVAQEGSTDHRWFQLDTEVLRTTGANGVDASAFRDAYLDLVGKAKSYGYSGVVLRGAELNALGPADQGRDAGWVAAMRDITAAARAAQLEVVMSYGSIGRCGRTLSANGLADLATAYPVTMAMKVNDGFLVPRRKVEPEDTLAGRQIDGDGSQWAQLDDLELGGQYRVTVGLAGVLTEGQITLRVVDESTGQILNALRWAKPVPEPAMPTMTIAFNSFRSTSVKVFVETGRRDSTLQLTSYAVEAVPTLNGVSRDGIIGSSPALAVQVFDGGAVVKTLTLGDGLSYPAGAHRDPLLGEWDGSVGSWSAAHTPPPLEIDESALPARYDRLRLKGWHALPYKNVVSCSWNDPKIEDLIERLGNYSRWLGGTASLLPFDEINSGGAEPRDGRGRQTSQALGRSITTLTATARGGDANHPVFIFGDMLDVNTNARPCYEHVVGTLNAPLPVPDDVTVLMWDESGLGEQHFLRRNDRCYAQPAGREFDVAKHREAGLANLSALTGDLMIAGYYDTDLVETDHADWQAAIMKSPVTEVAGVLYATWVHPSSCPAYPDGAGPYDCSSEPCKNDLETEGCAFEHLAEFARYWWNDAPPPPDRTCNGRAATIVGSARSEEIVGTSGADVIWAGGGDDTIFGQGGDDLICGGGGDDTIYAGPGADVVFAGAGANEVYGSTGDDELTGGRDHDRMWGGPGNDRLAGRAGNDRLIGGPDDDQLLGGTGFDELGGGDGDDRLNGGPDDDVCAGDEGTDRAINCEIQHE